MSAESSLTAVAVVRALLNQDTEGLAVLLPDGLPEPGRELMASLASLAVLSAKVAARAEGIEEGEYLDRIVRLWTGGPRLYRAGNGRAARGSSVTERGDVDPLRSDPGPASRRRRSARRVGQHRGGGQVLDPPGPGEFAHVVRLALAAARGLPAVSPGQCRRPALPSRAMPSDLQ